MMTLSKGKSKELFEISKAAATATAIIEGILAVQRTLGSVPYPWSIQLQQRAAAAAAVNVANIQSTNFKKGIDVVPGIGRGDKVSAMLEPGERVCTEGDKPGVN